jgi:alginate O-acetyltransferase complex protein AlgI
MLYLGYVGWGYRRPLAYLISCSLVFYGYYQLTYLPLLITVAMLDFLVARQIHRNTNQNLRRRWLAASVISNLGILGFFKYWNFVAENAAAATGAEAVVHTYLLPLGLSFYTLQTLSYVFDVYRRRSVPEPRPWLYFLYVSFFPQLIAGPIERSNRLLPQLAKLRKPATTGFKAGCVLVAWGLFIKLVAADNLGPFVDSAIRTPALGPLLWPTAALGMCRVYCDFLAYTAIARGLGKGFGVELTHNFRQPFFAKTLGGFWQRWHITLTRWVMDYVQIPLARKWSGEPFRSLITIGVLCLIGLWHGASWNFLLFGLFHGVVLRVWGPVANLLSASGVPALARETSSRLCLVIVLSASAPMFLIRDFGELLRILSAMLSFRGEWAALLPIAGKIRLALGLLALLAVLCVDWLFYKGADWSPERLSNAGAVGVVALLTALIVPFANFDVVPFVYFAF